MTDFFMGFVAACFLCACISVNMDSNYEYMEKVHDKINELCKGINSRPQSYDDFEVACENKIIIQYREWQ